MSQSFYIYLKGKFILLFVCKAPRMTDNITQVVLHKCDGHSKLWLHRLLDWVFGFVCLIPASNKCLKLTLVLQLNFIVFYNSNLSGS